MRGRGIDPPRWFVRWLENAGTIERGVVILGFMVLVFIAYAMALIAIAGEP